MPRGWSKVDLFDKHNRVLSGRWKVLVRVLPVRPGLTSREINTIPQVTVEKGFRLTFLVVIALLCDICTAPHSYLTSVLHKKLIT